jgi:preprotein translocase subunit SecA
MAGRGTDIKLGAGIPDLGGLFVIATERHESRRIDRQLRGRCARQGDPGMSQFFISFEDDLMRNFAAADRMTSMMERFGMEDGEALEHRWLNRSVETAQKRVEQRNYVWRKRVLDFDDVMNKQREVVYGLRNEVLNTENPRDLIHEIIGRVIPARIHEFLAERDEASPDYAELLGWIHANLPVRMTADEIGLGTRSAEEVAEAVVGKVRDAYEKRIARIDPAVVDQVERHIVMVAIDKQWQAHLYNMDALREGVHLRAQGQKDPLIEYKNEAYEMFVKLMDSIDGEALHNLFRSAASLEQFERQFHAAPHLMTGGEAALSADNLASTGSSAHLDPAVAAAAGSGQLKLNLPKKRPPQFDIDKVGRNAPCPCGSGKKFKHCCGREA